MWRRQHKPTPRPRRGLHLSKQRRRSGLEQLRNCCSSQSGGSLSISDPAARSVPPAFVLQAPVSRCPAGGRLDVGSCPRRCSRPPCPAHRSRNAFCGTRICSPLAFQMHACRGKAARAGFSGASDVTASCPVEEAESPRSTDARGSEAGAPLACRPGRHRDDAWLKEPGRCL